MAPAKKPNTASATPLARKLLAWYGAHARQLPWRAPPGAPPPPAYEVWLSEIMLQQTTVQAVKPYFEAFLTRWPRIEDLASASVDEVMGAWAGLGYYTRARKLHECAQTIAAAGGDFPDTEEGLQALPGIGPYTSAAIAAIAFGRPAGVVDGNVERVIARLYEIAEPLPGAKKIIKERVQNIVPRDRPGDFAQATMDLGAMICTPKRPACALCPWTGDCLARKSGRAETLPVKAPKPERPVRTGVAFWLERGDGQVLLRRRPPKGLLGGMLEIPSSPWTEANARDGAETALTHAPFAARWSRRVGPVRHTFTHFHLELDVVRARIKSSPRIESAIWVAKEDVLSAGLPSVMKKVATLALGL